jgi:formylglycine-generating enzyme required for sulfatase activity
MKKSRSIAVVLSLCLYVSIALTTNQEISASSKTPEGMVKIGNFYMDKYEFPNTIGEFPVTNVTWYEAKAMCESVGKRLCTAEEWVLACRGPKGLRFPYGHEYNGKMCNSESKVDAPLSIGATPESCVSGYGVYDLNGNVWEWVGTSLETGVSVRGGAWSSESCAECALKLWINSPNTKSNRGGFRCCK